MVPETQVRLIMRAGKLIQQLSIAALFLGCFFVLPSCENDEGDVRKAFEKKQGVEEGTNIESFMSQSGKVKAKLTAPYMLRYQAERQGDTAYIEFPRTLHVDFYDTTGKIESTVDALYAKYVEFDKKVLLRDSVKVISLKNGDRLLTKQLWWDQNAKEFYTSDTAYIYQTDKTIIAQKGLRAAQDLTRYTFLDAKGPILVPASGVPN